ncbi:hypothetical protein MP228_012265 [Amoeboaphelidium protococcarum]|nr:hypothetical protein MP228_012265 [Amoeboaphelidium protococcarum]
MEDYQKQIAAIFLDNRIRLLTKSQGALTQQHIAALRASMLKDQRLLKYLIELCLLCDFIEEAIGIFRNDYTKLVDGALNVTGTLRFLMQNAGIVAETNGMDWDCKYKSMINVDVKSKDYEQVLLWLRGKDVQSSDLTVNSLGLSRKVVDTRSVNNQSAHDIKVQLQSDIGISSALKSSSHLAERGSTPKQRRQQAKRNLPSDLENDLYNDEEEEVVSDFNTPSAIDTKKQEQLKVVEEAKSYDYSRAPPVDSSSWKSPFHSLSSIIPSFWKSSSSQPSRINKSDEIFSKSGRKKLRMVNTNAKMQQQSIPEVDDSSELQTQENSQILDGLNELTVVEGDDDDSLLVENQKSVGDIEQPSSTKSVRKSPSRGSKSPRKIGNSLLLGTSSPAMQQQQSSTRRVTRSQSPAKLSHDDVNSERDMVETEVKSDLQQSDGDTILHLSAKFKSPAVKKISELQQKSSPQQYQDSSQPSAGSSASPGRKSPSRSPPRKTKLGGYNSSPKAPDVRPYTNSPDKPLPQRKRLPIRASLNAEQKNEDASGTPEQQKEQTYQKKGKGEGRSKTESPKRQRVHSTPHPRRGRGASVENLVDQTPKSSRPVETPPSMRMVTRSMRKRQASSLSQTDDSQDGDE